MGVKKNKAEVVKLVEQLKAADLAYYNDHSLMTDSEYDELKDLLIEIDPNNPYLSEVGANVGASVWPKAKHDAPMGSLLKATNFDDLNKWAKKYTKGSFLCMHKLDGLSIELIYENGKFQQGITRGDGYTGDDITQNLKLMDFPKTISEKARVTIRGEMMLHLSCWKEQFPNDKNPRNSVSGTSRRLDGTGCEYICIYAYFVKVNDSSPKQRSEMLDLVKSYGFKVPRYEVISSVPVLQETIQKWGAERSSLDYEIDGLVICDNDQENFEKLGDAGNRPRAARAFKFTAEEATTVLEDVVWQTGRTGAITPVAIMRPIDLGGVTISRASLVNTEEIARLGVGIGSEIIIKRANDVIPKVVRAMTSGKVKILAPDNCPSCGTKTSFDGVRVNCENRDSCPAQSLKALVNFLQVLDVKGFGPKLVEKLMDTGRLKTLSDFYQLRVEDIANLEGLGEKSAAKVLKELGDKSKNVPMPIFIKSLGIPHVGETLSERVLPIYPSIEAIIEAGPEKLSAIPAVGSILAKKMIEGLTEKLPLANELRKHIEISPVKTQGLDSPTGALVKVSFCFTGFRDKELSEKAKSLGATELSGVSKNLTHLVADDPDGGSSKLQKARDLGVSVMSRETFQEFLIENSKGI